MFNIYCIPLTHCHSFICLDLLCIFVIKPLIPKNVTSYVDGPREKLFHRQIHNGLIFCYLDFQTWYFGLCYTDSRNQPAWLIKSKKIVKQDLKKESVKKFQFKFKYFPENVADEVIQDNTMRMLYKQVCRTLS